MTTIERLDPSDDDRFADYHAAYVSAQAEEWDRPYGFREKRAQLLDDTEYVEVIAVIARDDSGAIVGTGYVEFPLRDNLTLAYIGISVIPEHRRRGHGTALLDAFADLAREHGRTTLFAEARWPADAEESGHTRFAEASGFRLDLTDAHRVLFLPASLPEAPAEEGYTLHTWRGKCPDEWLDQYAVLLSLIVQEAPSGDYPLENEYFDAARIRSDEALLRKQGRRMQVSVALADDGTLAGHTQLVFPESDPEDVYQWDTLVLGDHRGHGLGLTLKVHAMQSSKDLLEGRRFIHTYNAVANEPMIAVNELMGFRLVAYNGEFVREL